jgi:acyl carrier protein
MHGCPRATGARNEPEPFWRIAMPTQETIREIIINLFELEADDVQSDRNLKELGIDSLMALDILTALEKQFHIKLPEENLKRFTTVQSIGTLVDEELERRIAS